MPNSQLNANVLGQLLLMQSVLINLPDKKSIFNFVCKGLLDIPGINRVFYCESDNNSESNPQIIKFPIVLGSSHFGVIEIDLSDIELFTPYQHYLDNFIFMIGVVLEERNQRLLNEQHQVLLEQRIAERTQELTLEKENLIESQRRFTNLMKNIRLLSIMLDVEGNIIFCNLFTLHLTKYDLNEIMGKNWFDIFLPIDIREQVKNIFKGIMQGNELALNYENEILTKDGEKLLISWNNTILYDVDKKIIGTASIGANITERKRAEEALIHKNHEYKELNEEYLILNEELSESLENLKKNNEQLELAKKQAEESSQLKTAFLQNLSHEIRTPMNAIMGFSELLVVNFNNKQKLEKFSGIIGHRCNDLLDIINDILDISKIDSGQLAVNLDVCNLDELFDEIQLIFSDYQKRIEKENISFILNKISLPNGNNIITDKVKLKQIFVNLISNAFKFTDYGIVDVGFKENSTETLFFYVKDTGIGIPKDKTAKIFERFTQLNQNPAKTGGGTGLGLSIVKGLLDLLGGEIFVDSDPDVGSSFTFSIPYIIPETQAATPITKGIEAYSFENKRILIVEDDIYNADYLNEVLTETGSKILIAVNSKEAIEICLNQPLDLVLMDIRLPDNDGYETTKQIRQYKPDLKIIAQTAYASNLERTKALEAGCVDYISKPVKKGLLLQIVSKYLS